MSAKTPQERAVQALYDGGEIMPLGRVKAQRQGGSVYAAIPATVVHSFGIKQSDEMVVGFHAPTNTIVMSPADVVGGDHWGAIE